MKNAITVGTNDSNISLYMPTWATYGSTSLSSGSPGCSSMVEQFGDKFMYSQDRISRRLVNKIPMKNAGVKRF